MYREKVHAPSMRHDRRMPDTGDVGVDGRVDGGGDGGAEGSGDGGGDGVDRR